MPAPRRRTGGRSATTDSSLTNPDSPAYAIASAFQHYLYMPDPLPLYVVLGMMAGNMLTGHPIWLMLAGASGSGKSALLGSVLGLDRVIPVASLKNEAALLSGTKKRDREKGPDASGGLLTRLGDNGCLVFTDFTSVLSKSRDSVNELISAFRLLYERRWGRDIGESGRRILHTGRVVMLAGCTNAIDRHHDVSAEMGERWIMYRMPHTEGYQESIQVSQRPITEKEEREMQDLTGLLYDGLDLRFDTPTRRREPTLQEADRIVSMAQLGSRARSHVPRDQYTKQVCDVVSREVSTRMTGELTQLYLGMEVIGVAEADRWRAVEKVALDSMTMSRRAVLEVVRAGKVGGRTGVARRAGLARAAGLSEKTADRVLEDLLLLGVMTRSGGAGGKDGAQGAEWELTEWTRERWRV